MFSLLPALLLSVAPAHADWTSTGSKYDCTFAKQDEGSVVALKADCTWPEPASKVEAVLGDWNKHGDVFDSVVSSQVVGTLVNGKGRVHQVHQASGITDREIFMDVASEPIDGGMRFTNTKSADQTGISPKRVEVGRDDGVWEVKATPSGGCKVHYELRYDPAGSVPGFIVHAFQGAGFKDMMDNLRTYVDAH